MLSFSRLARPYQRFTRNVLQHLAESSKFIVQYLLLMRYVYITIAYLLLYSMNSCALPVVPAPLISGPWLMTFTTPDAGRLQVLMTIEAEEHQRPDDGVPFHAYSEKNMDQKILGSLKARFGRLAGSNFRQGSLLRIVQGHFMHGDSLTGILITPFGNYYLHAQLDHQHISGILSDGRYKAIGSMEGIKGRPKLPLHDYLRIADSALKITESKLYDPALLKTPAWTGFRKELQRVSAATNDDAALVMAFFYFARKLPFSHFALYVPASADSSTATSTGTDLFLSEKSPHTAYLKINSFGGRASDMEKVFEEINSKGYRNLIVDLRGNPGGAIEAGMAFARHLIRDTLYAGVLLTRRYFDAHTTLPAPGDYSSFPAFSEANEHLLLREIAAYPGICLKGNPAAPGFRGKVYILTDRRTASTCEPIIYALKQHRLATIVGQTTAGAMLNGASFPAGDGFMITLPTATYYTSDGFKIDRQGVTPDIALKDEDALTYVSEQIKVEEKD